MALYGIIAFVIYGWVEFEAMAHVVDAIGGLLAFLGIFLTAIIGIRLLRSQSAIVMASFRADLARGQMNSTAIASSLSLLCGALLMLIPGYVTDAIGLLCFVPGIREIIGGFLATRLNARTMAGMSSPFAKGFSQQGFSQRGFSKDTPSEDNSFMGFHTSDEANAYQRTSDASDDVIEGEFKEKK